MIMWYDLYTVPKAERSNKNVEGINLELEIQLSAMQPILGNDVWHRYHLLTTIRWSLRFIRHVRCCYKSPY